MKKSRRHALGQHFLNNPRILKKIVQCIDPQKQDLIIEIGAGQGALTFLMAEKAGKIIALEKDASLIPLLNSRKLPHVIIKHADFLKTSLLKLASGKKGVKLVGNLPYSLSSPILDAVLAQREMIHIWHFLLQKEVAERLKAAPGTKKYAPLSILLQNDFSLHIHFNISPGSFTPPPQVESALISGVTHTEPLYFSGNRDLFRKFLQKAFSQRRKKISNSLKSAGFPGPQVNQVLMQAGIEPGQRPEQIAPEQYVGLFKGFYPQEEGP